MNLFYSLAWRGFARSIFALLLLSGCNQASHEISPDHSLAQARLGSSATSYSSDCVEMAPNPAMLCANIKAPVCGCNKVTYLNSCFAERVGIRVAYTGICGTVNPSLGGTRDCVEKAPNTDILCANIIATPVCGCNMVTYLNSCFAERVGIRVLYSGACKK